MSPVLQVVLLTTIAGAAIPIGGFLARIERIRPRWLEEELRHSVIAFGGGVLLSAVALVLVPHGVQQVSLPWVVVAMSLGGVLFMQFDRLIAKSQSSAAQLVAMLTDFVPEATALGAGFAVGDSVGLVLAMLIALQNLPEGFNAYRELADHGGLKPATILIAFLGLVPLGPLAGLAGYYWLASYPAVVGFIMLTAAGGILYLTFQDLAPQAKLERHWAPSLATVGGFLFGLVGNELLG